MISFQRARSVDASELIRVKINAFSEEAMLHGSGPPGYDSLEEQNKAIQYGYYYKILDNDKIIGGISVHDKGGGLYRIGSIFVDLAHQNQGIGTLTMQFIQDEFPEAQKWTLETPYMSLRNHHFYEKLGFVKAGETEPEPERNGFYLFIYEKCSTSVPFRYDAYCGLYCGACDTLLANKAGKVQELAAAWNMKSAQLRCHGCKTAINSEFCVSCVIKLCAKARKLEFCYECPAYPCSKITAFQQDQYAHHSAIIQNLARIRDTGVEKWLFEQEKCWSCPRCGTNFSWYQQKCGFCGAELAD